MVSIFSGSVHAGVADGEWGPEEGPAQVTLDDGQELQVFALFAPRGFHVAEESRYRSVYGRFRVTLAPLDERAAEWGGGECEGLLVKECWDGRWQEKLVGERTQLLARLFGPGALDEARDYGRWRIEIQELPYQSPAGWLPISEEENRLAELKAEEQGESKAGQPLEPTELTEVTVAVKADGLPEAELEERRRLAELILSGELPLDAVKA